MSNSDDSLYNYLREQDRKRLNIRQEFKTRMHFTKLAPLQGTSVIFPAMHIKTEHTFLRYGLSWLYNGFLIKTDDITVAVDPGVDFLYRLQISNIDPSSITHVYISHAHIDHYGGANTLMDWLIRAKKSVKILAPKSVYTSKSISDYHSARMKFPSGWKPMHSSMPLATNTKINLGLCTITPFSLFHSIECMGFHLDTTKGRLTYISDTGYAIKLQENARTINVVDGEVPQTDAFAYEDWHKDIDSQIAQSDLLIANIDSFYPNKNSATHMTLLDLVFLLNTSDTRIKQVVLGHVNPLAELEYEAWGQELAKYVEDNTGAKCYAPSITGLSISL